MAGFSNDVMYANNVRFDGGKYPGQVTTDGQLLIGSTVAPNIRVGTLTSTGGTLTVTNGPGTINLEVTPGGLAVDEIAVQANTPPGTNPVVPTGAGLLTINGAAVAAQAIPVQSNSLAANTLQIEVQISSAQAVSTPTANGLCHFDSTQFAVDAGGFVTALTGTVGWLDAVAPQALANHIGYFATIPGVYTLPAGAANGDQIEIVDISGGGVVVTAAGGDIIQISNVTSTPGGTATSTQSGDSLRLTFRLGDTTWYATPGASGNWILA